MVAALTHTGDNYRDQSAFARVENRPRHITALVDYLLMSWRYHDPLDPARVGMFGFSLEPNQLQEFDYLYAPVVGFLTLAKGQTNQRVLRV